MKHPSRVARLTRHASAVTALSTTQLDAVGGGLQMIPDCPLPPPVRDDGATETDLSTVEYVIVL